MTTLTLYSSSGSTEPLSSTSDTEQIRATLAGHGIVYERRPADAALGAGASAEQVLAAYRDEIDRITAARHYGSIDVYAITPDAPNKLAARQTFLAEHIHAEDEVRFLVEGQAAFYLHLGEQVYQLLVTRGDLLNVPAGAPHWFDMGPEPHFTAIRFLGSPEGWVGHFTGDPVSSRLPLLDAAATAAA